MRKLEEKNIYTATIITTETMQALEKLAQDKGLSVSNLVRSLVAEDLALKTPSSSSS